MPIVFADLLEERRVTLDLRARTRDEALEEIVRTMSGQDAVEQPDKFLAEVRAREEVHTTFMGNGVAFPHSRTALVNTIVLGIGRSRAGVPFGEGSELAHLVFVVGVPQRMVKDYLVCVGALARLTKDDANRKKLIAAESVEEFVDLLREASLLLE